MGRRLGTALAARRQIEHERLGAATHRLGTLDQRLVRAIGGHLAVARGKLERLDQLLHTLGYTQVLSRGFALVRDGDGRPLRRAAEVVPGGLLDIEFADGHRPAIAGEASGDSLDRPVAKPRTGRAGRKADQGSLF
jgi:exodeoxyribonuclease VII large subunit